MQEGVDNGEFAIDDARIATVALLSLGIDIARWYREDRAWSPEDIAREYAAIALRIVGGGLTTPTPPPRRWPSR